MSEELTQLKNKRKTIKSHLTRFSTFIENALNQKKYDEIETRLQKLDETWSDFNDLQEKIEEIEETENLERQSFEDRFFQLMSQGKAILSQRHNMQIQDQNLQNNVFGNFNVKLPLIDLPQFHGNYEGWLPFYEGFKALVIDNMSLNNIQRFYYLLSCLKSESIQVIQSLEVSNDNFDVAWQLLKERYENKRVIVHSHIKGIVELPVLSKENHTMLRKMIDTFLKHERALKSLGEPIDQWDTLLIYLLSNKLDHHTKREWEGSIKTNQLPNLKSFMEFLKNKAQLLETLDTRDHSKPSPKPFIRSLNHIATNEKSPVLEVTCSFCKANHFTYKCFKLMALPCKQRYIELRNLKICCNCLKGGHHADTCRSNRVCKTCKKRHNTALHSEGFNLNSDVNSPGREKNIDATKAQNASLHTSESGPAVTANNDLGDITVLSNTGLTNQILLSTVQLCIYDAYDKPIKCRALLDSGSQSNFITSELCKRLKLQTLKVNLPITGINQASLNIQNKTNANIKSNDESFAARLSFLVIDQITGNLPQIYFDPLNLNIPSNIQLSDPHYHKPGKIDMLLGSGIFFSLLNAEQISLGQNSPILQHTKLGWIIAGPLHIFNNIGCDESTVSSNIAINYLFSQNADPLREQLERFWQIEHLAASHSKLSTEELECEIHFRKHFQQDSSGRYIVQLPLKDNFIQLGDPFPTALKRLKSVETKLSRDENLRQQYNEFLREYEEMGHMTKIDTNWDQPNKIYKYLPHHAVVKESSTTTRVRVVFDASSKTSSGVSLNDVLKIGPTIQGDLFGILLRMRTFNIVITADITKMYRQIKLHESQRNLQRIIWRKNPNEPVCHYVLNTITYGTASASFLATRTLHQVGLSVKEIDPKASDTIINSFYMDDL